MRMSTVDRVLIVEDHPVAATMLQRVVERVFDSSTITQAGTLSEGFEAMKASTFHLALVDLGLPDGNGIDLIEAVSMNTQAFVVVTTVFDDDEHLFESLRAGAQGYLLKGHNEEDVEDFLRGILEGKPPLSPSIAHRILGHFRSPTAERPAPSSELTQREVEVLQLIAKGCHVGEVAEMLDIASSTVASHIKKIYHKLDIHNRAEAAAAAMSLNLYKP